MGERPSEGIFFGGGGGEGSHRARFCGVFAPVGILKMPSATLLRENRGRRTLFYISTGRTTLNNMDYTKRDPQSPAGLFNVVRMARVELAQAYAHHPLKVACLPFHHIRFWFGTAKIH